MRNCGSDNPADSWVKYKLLFTLIWALHFQRTMEEIFTAYNPFLPLGTLIP